MYKLAAGFKDGNVWLTFEQAAVEAQVTVRTIRRWASSGMLTVEIKGVRCVMRRHLRQQAYEVAELERKRAESLRPTRVSAREEA